MGDPADKPYRQLPAVSRQRGLPAIGFSLVTELEPTVTYPFRCCERAGDRIVGELVVEVFGAALIIDRDGILAAKASEPTGAPAVPIELPGATGFRSEAVAPLGKRGPLPYLYVFAIAPQDLAVEGGILITVRCARPDWPAAEAMLRSLRVLTRYGTAPANDELPVLPLIGI